MMEVDVVLILFRFSIIYVFKTIWYSLYTIAENFEIAFIWFESDFNRFSFRDYSENNNGAEKQNFAIFLQEEDVYREIKNRGEPESRRNGANDVLL